MARLTKLTVRTLKLNEQSILWETDEALIDITRQFFRVLRSFSPVDGFEKISPDLPGIFLFVDRFVNTESKHRKLYYKVQLFDVDTEKILTEIGPERVRFQPNRIALEITRRNELLLRRFVGVRSFVFLKKRFGPRCSECWDFIKSRSRKSDCGLCFNSGYENGFHRQITVPINYSPPTDAVNISALGELQDREANVWLSNFPLLSPRDIIVDPSNRRWRVATVDKTEFQRAIVHQVARIVELNTSDIEYKIPVEDEDIFTDIDKKVRMEPSIVKAEVKIERDKD